MEVREQELEGEGTKRRTPALMNTLAAIAIFLLVRLFVQAILRARETTREKQNPITIAWGINVFLENRKKKIAWVIPRPRYTAINTADAGISNFLSTSLRSRDGIPTPFRGMPPAG
jgi:hypothetical protein